MFETLIDISIKKMTYKEYNNTQAATMKDLTVNMGIIEYKTSDTNNDTFENLTPISQGLLRQTAISNAAIMTIAEVAKKLLNSMQNNNLGFINLEPLHLDVDRMYKCRFNLYHT